VGPGRHAPLVLWSPGSTPVRASSTRGCLIIPCLSQKDVLRPLACESLLREDSACLPHQFLCFSPGTNEPRRRVGPGADGMAEGAGNRGEGLDFGASRQTPLTRGSAAGVREIIYRSLMPNHRLVSRDDKRPEPLLES
jgi:hypothetical protein